jgi:4-hydroxy 2-oxovalerate aldolase
MNIIDVTLRDGGHAVNFDWSLDIAKGYYNIVSQIEGVSFVELGYWRQTAKSTNTHYNLDFDAVRKIVGPNPSKPVCVMIDYHYCTKDLEEYPTSEQDIIKMIRMCARKRDLTQALEFAQQLKEYTGLMVSINVFNVSNYSEEELLEVSKMVSEYDMDYVYFADTHGSLDLTVDGEIFGKVVKILKDGGVEVGMHLHDHSGKAYLNYTKLTELGFSSFDVSTRGMGKGIGNLRMEHVIGSSERTQLLQFVVQNEKLFTMRESPYALVTSAFSVTDYYGYNAEKVGISIPEFYEICSRIEGEDKDVYNKEILAVR